jgi:hypothetical protein
VKLPRALLVVLVLAVLVTAGSVVVGLVGGRSTPPEVAAAARAEQPPADDRPVGDRALAVLHAWDVRRAAAWARGDLAALGRLYVPGSAAGRADVAMLRAWSARGLRVRPLRMQVLSARVLARSGDRLVLDVTDRLARAVAVGPTGQVALPRDEASRRVVVMQRSAGEWRVAEVEAQPAR